MKLLVAAVSGKSPAWLNTVVEDYQNRLSHWFETEVRVLSSKSFSREEKEKKKNFENDLLLKLIKPDDFVVACDELGREFSSEKFSHQFEKFLVSGKKRIVFLIGGAYGLSDEIKSRANLVLSFSKLTLNHHMALAVLLEQIYRAQTISKGIAYHN